MKEMKVICDLLLDEERALYNENDINLINVKFTGPADGESAIKECKNVKIDTCYFDLRYPIWHVDECEISNSIMTSNCRAAIWYTNKIKINKSTMNGIKAVRECEDVEIYKTSIDSPEFGWKSKNIKLMNTKINGEYLFFDSKKIKLDNVQLKGKYSFQYVKDLEITDSYLDTKDAFWHAENITVKDSVLKGEYLGWYSKNLTLINCNIIGTQPLCYCDDLKLINCRTINCDLSFENSEVNGNIIGSIDSIKNMKDGVLEVDNVKEIINSDNRYVCKGKVIVKNDKK